MALTQISIASKAVSNEGPVSILDVPETGQTKIDNLSVYNATGDGLSFDVTPAKGDFTKGVKTHTGVDHRDMLPMIRLSPTRQIRIFKDGLDVEKQHVFAQVIEWDAAAGHHRTGPALLIDGDHPMALNGSAAVALSEDHILYLSHDGRFAQTLKITETLVIASLGADNSFQAQMNQRPVSLAKVSDNQALMLYESSSGQSKFRLINAPMDQRPAFDDGDITASGVSLGSSAGINQRMVRATNASQDYVILGSEGTGSWRVTSFNLDPVAKTGIQGATTVFAVSSSAGSDQKSLVKIGPDDEFGVAFLYADQSGGRGPFRVQVFKNAALTDILSASAGGSGMFVNGWDTLKTGQGILTTSGAARTSGITSLQTYVDLAGDTVNLYLSESASRYNLRMFGTDYGLYFIDRQYQYKAVFPENPGGISWQYVYGGDSDDAILFYNTSPNLAYWDEGYQVWVTVLAGNAFGYFDKTGKPVGASFSSLNYIDCICPSTTKGQVFAMSGGSSSLSGEGSVTSREFLPEIAFGGALDVIESVSYNYSNAWRLVSCAPADVGYFVAGWYYTGSGSYYGFVGHYNPTNTSLTRIIGGTESDIVKNFANYAVVSSGNVMLGACLYTNDAIAIYAKEWSGQAFLNASGENIGNSFAKAISREKAGARAVKFQTASGRGAVLGAVGTVAYVHKDGVTGLRNLSETPAQHEAIHNMQVFCDDSFVGYTYGYLEVSQDGFRSLKRLYKVSDLSTPIAAQDVDEPAQAGGYFVGHIGSLEPNGGYQYQQAFTYAQSPSTVAKKLPEKQTVFVDVALQIAGDAYTLIKAMPVAAGQSVELSHNKLLPQGAKIVMQSSAFRPLHISGVALIKE